MSGGEVTDDDKMYCESIAKSISDIIRFSLNEEYRKNCCELFGVSSTTETEKEIGKRLMSILENSGREACKKGCKNLSKEENGETTQRLNDAPYERTDSSTNSEGCQNASNMPEKNWLRISCRQYREVVKRKKLRFYSQPTPQDLGPTNCQGSYTNSQTSMFAAEPNELEDTSWNPSRSG